MLRPTRLLLKWHDDCVGDELAMTLPKEVLRWYRQMPPLDPRPHGGAPCSQLFDSLCILLRFARARLKCEMENPSRSVDGRERTSVQLSQNTRSIGMAR